MSISQKKLQFLIAVVFVVEISLGCSQVSNKNQISSIIDDIRNNRFSSAEQKINTAKDDTQLIPSLIDAVYSKTENNTNLILDFAHNVIQANVSFQILKELRNQMTANNHSDPLKLMALYRGFESDVIFKHSPKPQLTPEIKAIIEEVKANVSASAKRILKAAMFANDFEGNDYIKNVTEGIFNFFYEISDEVMLALVNETYPDVKAAQIAENMMFGSTYIPQKIRFFVALYEKLEANEDLNNDAVLKIAYYVRILKKSTTYRNTFQPLKYAANAMIKRMPTCARNLYFSDAMCIWNRGRDEYLYAAGSQHNLSRRGIYTYEPGYLTPGGLWEPDFYADVYLKSLRYDKEYLYASTTDKFDKMQRHVATWVDDGFVGDTCAWKIELNGDFCYFRNVNFFNEYLCVSDVLFEDKARYVFTAKRGPEFSQQDFQWQIRNCV